MANQSDEKKSVDLIEDPDALQEKLIESGDLFSKYKKVILGVLILIIVGIAGFFGYKYNLQQQNQQAQEEIYHAIYAWEEDSLNLALEGDLLSKGFLDIINEYGGTEAANLAHYYVGDIYLKQGKYEEAIQYLKDFSADDLLIQARAYKLIGDAYMELEQYDQAASYYANAADYKPNEYFTPVYLMDLALAYEMQGNYDAAVETYDNLIDNYPGFQNLNEAKKYRARALAMARDTQAGA